MGAGDFRFAEDPEEYRKNLVLARKYSESKNGIIEYMANRPFGRIWKYRKIGGIY